MNIVDYTKKLLLKEKISQSDFGDPKKIVVLQSALSSGLTRENAKEIWQNHREAIEEWLGENFLELGDFGYSLADVIEGDIENIRWVVVHRYVENKILPILAGVADEV